MHCRGVSEAIEKDFRALDGDHSAVYRISAAMDRRPTSARYLGRGYRELAFRDWTTHPNATGSRLESEELMDEKTEQQGLALSSRVYEGACNSVQLLEPDLVEHISPTNSRSAFYV